MNGKKARALRKLLGCDLGRGTVYKDVEEEVVGSQTIGQIQPDGNHTSREQNVTRLRTSATREVYRQVKRYYGRSLNNEKVRDNIVDDLTLAKDIADRADEALEEYVFSDLNPNEELGKDNK